MLLKYPSSIPFPKNRNWGTKVMRRRRYFCPRMSKGPFNQHKSWPDPSPFLPQKSSKSFQSENDLPPFVSPIFSPESTHIIRLSSFAPHTKMTKHRLTKNRRCWLWPCGCLLLLVLGCLNGPEVVLGRIKAVEICDYFRAIGKLDTRPDCSQPMPISTTPRATESNSEEKLPSCSAHAHLVQCTAESEECPGSGQLCTQSDASQCCQEALQGIPVSHINSKPGNCPQPVGISLLQDGSTGCWLDTNCPGIQKCCLEPSPIQHTARRICRDPNGISSDSICTLPLIVGTCTAFVTRYYFDQSTGKCKPFQYSGCGGNANNFQSLQSCHSTCGLLGVKGTPSCPSEANAELNCLLPHADACHTDSDCMGREGGQQPSCCMTKCGYRICYIY